MKTNFSNFKAWKEAVVAAGLVLERNYPTHEGPHESDMFEPTFCGKEIHGGEDHGSFEQFGMFCTEVANEAGTEFSSSGFICTTHHEFCEELNREDDQQEESPKLSKYGQDISDACGPNDK